MQGDAHDDVDDEALALLAGAVARLDAGERVEAWRAVRRAIAAAPGAGRVRVLAAPLLAVLGDHGGALDAATAAVELGVASAASLRCDLARALGAYHEARAALEDALRDAAADQRRAGTRIDALLEQLVLLLGNADHYDGAAAALDRHLPRGPMPAPVWVRAARTYARTGERDKAREAIRRALAAERATASTSLAVARVLLEIEAFDEAQAIFESLVERAATSATALEALGRLCLWRGDAAGALAYAARLRALQPPSPAGCRSEAAVHVLRGDPAAALPLLDAALGADPRDGEAYLWRAEAYLRLGRDDDALADTQRSGVECGDFFAAGALRLLVDLNRERSRLSPVRLLTSRRAGTLGALLRAGLRPFVYAPGIAAHAEREFTAELAAVCGDAPVLLAKRSAGDLAWLLDRALVAMRGNRTPLATWIGADGRLRRLPPSQSARVASRHALELIKVAPATETLRHFDALIARFPDSSMPLVHRGELHLWLGRYDEARADLDAAIARCPQTRWAWYGLACLDLIAGDPERALATCARGIRVMDNTEGPVAYLYRGEAYRLLGRLAEARAQLLRSCTLHPTRLSAWINLALVHGAAGDHSARLAVFRHLAQAAPHFVAEAAAELGDQVFEAAVLTASNPGADVLDPLLRGMLAMMRGNRASGCVTYFTSRGRMRYVAQRPPGEGAAREAQARILGELRRRIVAGGRRVPDGPPSAPS